jgi:hypothetical protein
MTDWVSYPATYRQLETAAITQAARAGDCVSVVGLSGAGKSNLLGFLANRPAEVPVRFVLVDGNRLSAQTPESFLWLMYRSLPAAGRQGPSETAPEVGKALETLEWAVARCLEDPENPDLRLCWLLDLSLLLGRDGRLFGGESRSFFNNLRALRDRHKYRLVYVAATRHMLPSDNELAELFFGRTVWLGPLSAEDAAWNVTRYAERTGQSWPESTRQAIAEVSGRYPALLRAVCEAHAGGARLEEAALAEHPAVARRLEEFWADRPSEAELSAAGLTGISLLMRERPLHVGSAQLTAKENLLLEYLAGRPDEVCEKDDVIRAVWPEDQIFERGVRDDSLAQLVRRLREKIERDPARPRHVHTVPGRGYRFTVRPG